MDEYHRAVGSNPTSSANPLSWLYAFIRKPSADELGSTHDSRTLKVLCFLSPLAFVETHVEVHLSRARGFFPGFTLVSGMRQDSFPICSEIKCCDLQTA